MKSLSEILLRHPIPGLRQSERGRVCAEVIQNALTIPIKAEQIVYKNNILTFKVPSVMRSEILLNKNKLLTLFKDVGVEVKDLN